MGLNSESGGCYGPAGMRNSCPTRMLKLLKPLRCATTFLLLQLLQKLTATLQLVELVLLRVIAHRVNRVDLEVRMVPVDE